MKAQNPRIMILTRKTKKLRRNCPIKRKMVWKGHRRRKRKGQATVLRHHPKGLQRKPQRREGHPSWSGHLLLWRKVVLFFVCMLNEMVFLSNIVITTTCLEILSDQGWHSWCFGATRGGRKKGRVLGLIKSPQHCHAIKNQGCFELFSKSIRLSVAILFQVHGPIMVGSGQVQRGVQRNWRYKIRCSQRIVQDQALSSVNHSKKPIVPLHSRGHLLYPLFRQGAQASECCYLSRAPGFFGLLINHIDVTCSIFLWSHALASRFVTRSFFVAPVEQKHVNKVLKAFGGPKLKAGHSQFSSKAFLDRRYTCACGEPMGQVSETSRKSVTVSWGKNGGLKESPGSQKIGFYFTASFTWSMMHAVLKAQHFFRLRYRLCVCEF